MSLSNALPSWLNARNIARVAACAALFCVLRTVFALTLHDITPVRVTASGTLSDDARFAPEKVVDHSTVEALTLHNYWLLPSEAKGWLRLDLGDEYRLDRLQILNTRDGRLFDRGTRRYRIELLGPAGSSFFSDRLPAYPFWKEHVFPGPVVHAVILHVEKYEGQGGGLDEIALTGRRAHGLGAHEDTLLALLGMGLLSALVLKWPDRWRAAVTLERVCLVVLALTLVVVGQRLLLFSTSLSTLEWGLVFDIAELDTLGKVKAFFANLVIPIPPVLALVEIVAQQLTGNNDFVIKTVYKVSIVGAYLAALALSYPSLSRMLASFFLGLLFISSTAILHPENPQIYDTVFPFLVMVFLVLLSAAWDVPEAQGRRRALWLAAAGLCLSLVGLTRPFAIVLVLATVLFVVSRLPGRRRQVLPFVLGACLLAGPWQAYLLIRHGQLTISNHSGFNLKNAWPMVPLPPLLEEDSTPPHRVFNNPQHLVNSQRIGRAVLTYALEHPLLALDNVAHRLERITEAKTSIYSDVEIKPGLLSLYQMVVRFLSLGVFVAVALRLARWTSLQFRRLRGAEQTLPLPSRYEAVSTLLLGLTAGSLGLLAVGDAGEEYRFMISVLPLLAAVPSLVLTCARGRRPAR